MEESDNDWRMHDVFYLSKDHEFPDTGQVAERGSQLTLQSVTQLSKKKHLSIALPNATALFLSASKRNWKEALNIRKKSNIDNSLKKQVTFTSKSESFDYVERIMESIVMAFTALEAFVNENIPEDFEYHTNRKSKIIIEVMCKSDIERWLSLDEKLTKVLPIAKDTASPKQNRCWSGYKDLKKTRDRIIHMKKEDRRSSGPEIPTLWHKLLKLNAPYIQAKEVIDFFVKETGEIPRWYHEYQKST